MVALYIVLGLIAATCLFLFLRAKIFVIWANELFIRIGLGPFSYEIPVSRFIKKRSEQTTAEKEPKKPKEKKKPKAKKQKEKKPKAKIPLIKQIELLKDLAVSAFLRFGKAIRVEKFVFKVSVGTADAAQTAMLYGAISAAMANLTHAILNYRHKRGAEIYSECKPDFLSESMDIYVDIGASVMLWSYVIALFSLGIKALWGFLKLKFKYRKNIPAKHGENPLKNKNP